MLSIIAPFGIAEAIRATALLVPREAQTVAFAILLTIYLYILVKLAAGIYCRLDFSMATIIRRMRGTPPSLQFWAGDFVEAMPRRVILIGFLLILSTVAYAIIEYGVKPKPGIWLFSAKTTLAQFIVWLKS